MRSKRAQLETRAGKRRAKAAREKAEEIRARYRPPAREGERRVPRWAHANWWKRSEVRRRQRAAGKSDLGVREVAEKLGVVERMRRALGAGGFRRRKAGR